MVGNKLKTSFKTAGLILSGVAFAIAATAPLAQVSSLQGDITIEGSVQAPPPTQPAVITQPVNGQQFQQSPITVSGTCSGTDTIVEIYKNDVFGGSGPCIDGAFSITVDLFIGQNILIAKIKDNLGQYGPDSSPVTVTYQPVNPGPINPSGGSGGDGQATSPESQLLLLIDTDYRGVFPDEALTIQPTILGGQPPYAVKIDWGDGTEEIIARRSNGQFDVRHIYTQPGIKTIKIYASDEAGQKAYVQTVAIVNGPVELEEDTAIIVSSPSSYPWWLWLIVAILFLVCGTLLGLFLSRKRQRNLQNSRF